MQILVAVVVLAISFVVLSIGFGFIERRWPSIPAQPRWRTDSRTDLAYWFFIPTVGKAFATAATGLVIALAVGVFAGEVSKQAVLDFANRDTVFRSWPLWVQAILVLVVADFGAYWSHWVFHHWAPAWRFHAIHHSSRQVDWLSSIRLHPINDAARGVASALLVISFGFDFSLAAVIVPFLTLYAIGVHANVPWDLGPLRYVITSPRFHRWHHTKEAEGLDKNLAGLFPFWDIAFGTLYMPKDRQPQEFGITDDSVPDGFWRQLVYPFWTGVGRKAREQE